MIQPVLERDVTYEHAISVAHLDDVQRRELTDCFANRSSGYTKFFPKLNFCRKRVARLKVFVQDVILDSASCTGRGASRIRSRKIWDIIRGH